MPETHPCIGVVTVTYNCEGVIDAFMESLLAQTQRDFHLFVVDNASGDSTLSALEKWQDPRITTIANLSNLGVAEGNNQGIRAAIAAGCQNILLLNNDTVFPSNLFSELLKGLEDHQCEMVTPKMFYFDDPKRIWVAGGGFQPWKAFETTHYGCGELDAGQFDTPRQITYTPTCCLLVKAGVFSIIGLMDSTYFVYFDDVDFMFRAMKAGIRTYYVPSGLLYHKIGYSTGGQESSFALTYCSRNNAYFLCKHFSLLARLPLLLYFPVRTLWRLLRGKDSMSTFQIKMKSYAQGLTVPTGSGMIPGESSSGSTGKAARV